MQKKRSQRHIPKSSQRHGPKRAAPPRLRRRIFMGLAALTLSAAMPPSGLENSGRKLADAELADMRGKFVAPEGVSYFGVALQTTWQSSDGITTMATMLLNVSFAGKALGSATPELLVGWTRDCGECGDAAMDVSTTSGAATVVPAGLNSVNGVVQSQLVNGTDNNVSNAMTITILPPGHVMQPGGEGLTRVNASTSQSFEDGDTVQFILQPGQLGLSMKEVDGGMVQQSVNSELNQAAQHVLLNSSFNSISNVMGITVGLSELQQTDRLQVENALSAMKGHGL